MTDYTDLLNGCTFTNRRGETVRHKGLKFVIAYMVYSRYLGESFVADTFSGFVQKTRQDSEQLSEGSIRRLQENNRQIALTEWELIKEYLDINSGLYPFWKRESKKVYRPRIYGVRRVNYGR